MKRFRLVASLMFAVTLCLGGLASCGPSAADLIREDITSEFDELKASQDDLLDEIAAASGEDFTALGIDAKAFAASYLEGFDYQIDDIKVEDTTADVQVTVTLKSISDILSSFQTAYVEKLQTLDLATLADEQGLYTLAGQTLMEMVESAKPAENTFTITYEKDEDGVWSTTEDAETAITNAFLS